MRPADRRSSLLQHLRRQPCHLRNSGKQEHQQRPDHRLREVRYKQEWQTTGYAGSNGFATFNNEWEDTYRSPTGSFTFTEALGRKNPGTALSYHTIKPTSRWGGEPGPKYNQYFEGRGGESDENLYTNMNAGYYEQAAVINWNRQPDMEVTQHASFAIFFHAGNVPSAACISTHLGTVTRLLQTNRPGDRIVMGAVSDVFKGSAYGTDTTLGKTLASIRSGSDVTAADASGRLWNYPAAGNGGLTMRYQIGAGWWNLLTVRPVDWNSDGIFDLLAQWKNGTMTVYTGKASGGFNAPILVGSGGWGSMKIVAGVWDKSRKFPGVIAKDTSGKLWLYSNPSGSALSTRRLIGNAWQSSTTLTIADWDNNGTPELLSTDTSGVMRLYRQDGRGNFLNQARPIIGRGWVGIRSIRASYGLDGRGSRGVTMTNTKGQVVYYPLGNSYWGDARTIGYGFNSMQNIAY
ncbi:hypothetical protein ACQR35_12890 [Pseudarthrobacter sp. J1738]|uniref:hypothetical protein n=1 Tax=Pseudarthrobacter sp. J1738 TaxID=3420446 RepID=UPI003D275AC0